jgi:ribosomal protein L1
MATAKKTTDVPSEAEEQIVNAEATLVAEAKEEADGATQENIEAGSENSTDQEVAETKTAKAGKRSAKGLAETEAKVEKIVHQQHRTDDEGEAASQPKQPSKPTRTRLERRGKGYRKSAELIESGKVYGLKDAFGLVTKTSSVKFDASVELHINLGVDPRQAEQNIRASLVLPQGTGKTVRIAVFTDDTVDGADLSGIEAISQELEKGTINFDILIATPANMAKLGKYARLLGPRGLMPNPKSGTVTTDVAKAVQEAKAGRVEYRVDSTGIVHLPIGKVSFGSEKLLENANAVLTSIKSAKPNTVKGTYIKAVHVTTTMGPSIQVSSNE